MRFLAVNGVVRPSGGSRHSPVMLRSCSCQVVQTPAVVGQCHQTSLALDLVDAVQQELPETHRLLDDREHRFHRPLTESITGGLLPLRPRCHRRTEVVSPPPRSCCDGTRRWGRGPGDSSTPHTEPQCPGMLPARFAANRISRWRSSTPTTPASSAGGIGPTLYRARLPRTPTSTPDSPLSPRNATDRPPAPSPACLPAADTIVTDHALRISPSNNSRQGYAYTLESPSPTKSDRLLAGESGP